MADIKQEIFDYLKSQGLQPEETPFGIYFKYQMLNFLVFHEDEDSQFFRIALPEVAKFPKLTAVDPAARRRAAWRKFFCWLFVLLVAAFCFLFFTNRLAKYGLPRHKPQPVEEVVEECCEEAPAAEPTLEEAAEAAAEAPADPE